MDLESLFRLILISNILIPAIITAFFAASLSIGLQSGLTKEWSILGGVIGIYLSLALFKSVEPGQLSMGYIGSLLMVSGGAASVILLLILVVEISIRWALSRGGIEHHWNTFIHASRISLAIFTVGVSLEYIGAALRLL